MKDNCFIALIRGINVGGRNIIKMTDLKLLIESLGYKNVETYIQSGNIVFTIPSLNKTIEEHEEIIRTAISEKLKNSILVTLLSFKEIENVVLSKPSKFGEENEIYKYDVLFILEKTDIISEIKKMKIADGIDDVYAGERVIYTRRLKADLSKSKIHDIIRQPIYKKITIRNWNTTEKLYEMMKVMADLDNALG